MISCDIRQLGSELLSPKFFISRIWDGAWSSAVADDFQVPAAAGTKPKAEQFRSSDKSERLSPTTCKDLWWWGTRQAGGVKGGTREWLCLQTQPRGMPLTRQ